MNIEAGRHTALAPAGEHVVFLIGMRVNRLLAVRAWWRVAQAMPKMLAQLAQHPEMGLRHSEYFVGWRMVLLVQYWESFEKLERFARAKELSHVPAWREFNQHVAATDAVGIFHETYLVSGARSESVYVNMPRFGLGRAYEHGPVARRGQSAGRRIGARSEDLVLD